jgi:1-acyl-sn-glycerol-3-phosphate acyltransferase
MRRVLFGLFAYFEFFFLALVFLVPMGITALAKGRRDPTMRIRGRWMRRFGRLTGTLMPFWRFSMDGEAPADVRSRGYVVISNHESAADPFLITWLPWDMRWIAKQELFDAPLIGWLLKLSADIPILRGSRESVEHMMDECRKTLLAGMPVVLFPEGTRSADGTVLPFKDGAFQLAIETQSPILLLAISGTRECRPKGSSWFGDADARVRVLGSLSTRGLTMEDLPRLKEAAWTRISEGARRLRLDLAEDTAQHRRPRTVNLVWPDPDDVTALPVGSSQRP